MIITLYSMPDSPGNIHASWWPVFWEALARTLKMTIAIIDPKGRLLSLHNPLYPAAMHQKHPSLIAAFDNFYSRVPQIFAERKEGQLVFDPLGLPESMALLVDGSFMLLGGRLEEREPQRLAELSERLSDLEVFDRGQFWTQMTLVAPEEMKEYLAMVVELYNSIYHYFSKPGLPEILAAVENVNKLIALTFDPEHFDLNAIMELIASFLVAIAGGGSAFAFSYEYPGRPLTLWCGEHSHILETLADDWKTLSRVKDPAKTFDSLVRERVENEHALTFQGITRTRNGATVYLGLIGNEGGHFRKALVALVKKAAIALGVSSLSTVFQHRWGLVFNSIRQGIIVTDNRGMILMMNQGAKQFFSGYGVMVPAAGQPVTGCGFGRQIEEAVCIAAKSNRSFMQKRSAIGEGESLAHLRWDVVPLLREDGCSAGAVLVFNDITEPVKLHHEIQDWERMATAGEIAAGLAHEIRNPLATAKAAIQLIRMVKDQVKQEELLNKLERELDRMNDILTNFLNISKPMPEKKQEPVNLNQVLQELLFLLNSEALLNEIDLEINFSTGKPLVVLGSPDSIKQVFLNIARNAIEAMENGGKLSISTSLYNGRAQVTFQDNGPGIPEENMATLTKPFFTTKPGGTGLGLSISSSIVRMMGGDLTIKSSLGKGTTVNISLPAYEDKV
ncbi:MAG: ATP-binding protein [Dethiobacteria bacterium]